MRKIVALIILAVVLSACTAQPPTDETAQEQAIPAEQAITEEPEKTIEELKEQVKEQVQEQGKQIAERLAQEQEQKIIETVQEPPKLAPRDRTTIIEQMQKTASQLESYQYRTSKGSFFVRGDKIRIKLLEPIIKHNFKRADKNYDQVIFDEIIINRADKTATAYCAGFTEGVRLQCENKKLWDLDFPIPYEEVNPKTPEDLTAEYVNEQPTAEEPDKYYINSVLTTRVALKNGAEIYFYPKAGLPVRVVLGPLEKVDFEDLVINQVRPEDVTHRSRKDIPSSEIFTKPQY